MKKEERISKEQELERLLKELQRRDVFRDLKDPKEWRD